MLGIGHFFRDAPFFWSQHYDAQISYAGHASSWCGFEIRGDLPGWNACAIYRQNNRVAAVGTIGRDRLSLAAEAAFERGDTDAVESMFKNL
jgi:hypothetical protein